VSILDDLVDADERGGTVVWSHLYFEVSNVHESLNYFHFPVAVPYSCAWWGIAVVACVGHEVDCALWHCGHLSSGVDNSIDIAQFVSLQVVFGLSHPSV